VYLEKTHLDGLLVITPKIFNDERGYFFEDYHNEKYAQLGIPILLQSNISYSKKGVLRGMHYQSYPHAQGKLVRAIEGTIQDIAIDIRPDSKTYRQFYSVDLSSENNKQLWVPPGFAHGFLVLSDTAKVLYQCSALYHPESEGCIRWNDPGLKLPWKLDNGVIPIVSEKDNNPKL